MILSEKRQNILNTLQKYKNELEQDGYKVFYIGLKGSQNYNLDDEYSDIDACAIYLPTLKQLRTKKTTKRVFDTGEVVVHDIYSFSEIVAKGNPQWIEVCHTKYYLGEQLDFLKGFKINPKAVKGMLHQKLDDFERYKMSDQIRAAKNLHHALRLCDTISNIDKPIIRYFGKVRQNLLDIKRLEINYILNSDTVNTWQGTITEEFNKHYEQCELHTKPEIPYEKLDDIVLDYLATIRRV